MLGYYALGGTVVASRTGATSVAYLAGDTQGTDSVAIDAVTLAVTRRYYDPYGNPRGTVPTVFPTGQQGFVGGTTDSATGLTNLGAREYQPTTGTFISPDSLVEQYEPQDLNPYAYAEHNPTTYSDPSGTTRCDAGDCPTPYQDTHGGNFCQTHDCNDTPYNGPAYADPDNNPYSGGGPDPYNPAKYEKRQKYLEAHRAYARHMEELTRKRRQVEERAARKRADQQAAAARKAAAAAAHQAWCPEAIHLGTCIDTTGASPVPAIIGAWHRPGDVASVAAAVACFTPGVDLVGCGPAQGAAYLIRASQRDESGDPETLRNNVVDLMFSVGTFGSGAPVDNALSKFTEEQIEELLPHGGETCPGY
jgi:RHS repeat-associated protein